MPCCKTEVPKNGAMKKQGIGKMPCCKTEVPKNGAMKKQGIGKMPMPCFQKIFRVKFRCRKAYLPRKLFAKNHSATDPIVRIR